MRRFPWSEKEVGSWHDWPFLNQTVVISDAAHKGPSSPQFSPNLRCRLKQPFVTLKVRKGIVHAHDSVEISVREFQSNPTCPRRMAEHSNASWQLPHGSVQLTQD